MFLVSAAVLLVSFGIGIGACSSAGNRNTTGARRSSNGGSVVFDALPQYKDATPVGSPNVHGTKTTQTFTVDNASPKEVLAFYSEKLASWEVISKPHALGQSPQADWGGTWKRGNQRLLVSAAESPGSGHGRTQYSLDLRS